jgi:hypothetical protein
LSESDDNETDEYGSESVSNPDSYNNTNDLNITKMNWFDNAKIRYGLILVRVDEYFIFLKF